MFLCNLCNDSTFILLRTPVVGVEQDKAEKKYLTVYYTIRINVAC